MIDDPRYSRPLDVHRWSDHPEVKALVEDIWEGYLPEEITGKPGEKRTGPKPKTSFKKMLRVLILDLYVAWKEDPVSQCAPQLLVRQFKGQLCGLHCRWSPQ